MKTEPAAVGAFCRPCDAYTDPGTPCWLCGSTELEKLYAPTMGWRHNPNVQTASSVAGLIEVDE